MTHHVRMTHSLHSSLGYHLSRASRVQERRLDDGLRLLGITRTTWCILLAVGNEGLTRPSDIAAFIGIHRTATSRALRLMEDAGLVARTAGAEGRRITVVELTPLGQQRLAEGTPLAVANNPAMAKRLFKAEHPQLASLLRRLTHGAEALEKIWGRPSRPHHGQPPANTKRSGPMGLSASRECRPRVHRVGIGGADAIAKCNHPGVIHHKKIKH